MCDKNVLIKGYQPVVRVQNGYQPVALLQKNIVANTTVSTPLATVNITPPKGGTGEVRKK